MCIDGYGTIEEVAVHGWLPTDADAFAAWARDAYQLTDDSWDPAGAQDYNDGTLPYGKTLLAIAVICYGLRDDLRQWHSSEDYLSCSRAANNRFHGSFYMRFIEEGGPAEADANTGRIGRDRTNLHCLIFNVGSISSFPSHRAGVLIHEAWHHWQHRHRLSTEHSTACVSGRCDTYSFHGHSAYAFGQLHEWSIKTNPDGTWQVTRLHSPYQVEAEFFADLAEFSNPSLPHVAARTARDHGNTLLTKYFINRVPYRIGDPRPF